MFYHLFIRPSLFKLDAEIAHHATFAFIEKWQKVPGVVPFFRFLYRVSSPKLERKLWGLTFPNPVGLAAGFDKDARIGTGWQAFGFGFVEIGTITPRPQEGNPKPRLFRLVKDEAIVNRMGFNNEGLEAAIHRLQNKSREGIILGANIGKNKDTPNEQAVNDYLKCLDALHPFVDYFVVNVSSPNTPGLRALQEKEPLTEIMQSLYKRNKEKDHPKPILLKIAPDLTDAQLDDVLWVVKEAKVAGIVASNTTLSREGLRTNKSDVDAIGNGGLSGKPLTKRNTEIIRYLHQKSGGKVPIIAVGGIMTAGDALEKLQAGASLVQLYTGFIYNGPSLVKEICNALKKG